MEDIINSVLPYLKWIIENGPALLTGLAGLLSAVIVIALLIPGPEPETTLQKIVDFLKRFSRKS